MGKENSNGIAIIMIFIGAIIAATLMVPIADQIFDQTNSRTATNVTTVMPAAVNTTVDLEGRNLIGTITLVNDTFDDVSQFYIKDERLSSNSGLLTVAVTSNSTSGVGNTLGQTVNATYEFKPDGSAVNSTDSSLIRLILIFAALAVLFFVLAMVFGMEAMKNLLDR